jgi:hypothetical protein
MSIEIIDVKYDNEESVLTVDVQCNPGDKGSVVTLELRKDGNTIAGGLSDNTASVDANGLARIKATVRANTNSSTLYVLRAQREGSRLTAWVLWRLRN